MVKRYWTVTATTAVCVILPDVAVMVTFDVAGAAAVPAMLADDEQPTIKPEKATRTARTPRMRRLLKRLLRSSASSDPKGSISAEAMPNSLPRLRLFNSDRMEPPLGEPPVPAPPTVGVVEA